MFMSSKYFGSDDCDFSFLYTNVAYLHNLESLLGQWQTDEES